MLEFDNKIFNKEVSKLVANGRQYPFSIETSQDTASKFASIFAVDKTYPFKRKIGYNIAAIIAKSRDRTSIEEIKPTMTRLLKCL